MFRRLEPARWPFAKPLPDWLAGEPDCMSRLRMSLPVTNVTVVATVGIQPWGRFTDDEKAGTRVKKAPQTRHACGSRSAGGVEYVDAVFRPFPFKVFRSVSVVCSDIAVRFFIESDMDEPELVDAVDGHVVAFSRRCPGKQEPNDDSVGVFYCPGDAMVLAVADGMGGGPLGHKASCIAVQCLRDSLAQQITPGDLRPAVLDGIDQANAEILDLGVGAATTLSVVEIRGRMARCYQVGDSMSLIVGQRGVVKWKSTAHSPVGYAVESGLLDETDAMHHDERHIVSNMVGSRTMHIDIGPAMTLSPRDTIVVASDGLFDNLYIDEVCEFSRIGRPLERCQAMIDLAAKRMESDQEDSIGKPDDMALLMLTP